MDVGIFGNKLYLRNVNVGSKFDDLQCDLTIDRRGRAMLILGKTNVIVDLESIDQTVLSVAIEYLGTSDDRSAFKSAFKKMQAIL